MATNISEWRTEVQARCPGLSTSDCDAAVLKVLREFCKFTRCWQAELTTIEIQAHVSEYSLSRSGADIWRVEKAFIGERRIFPYSQRRLDGQFVTEWDRANYDVETPYWFDYNDRSGKIKLIYTPNTASDALVTPDDLTFDASDKTILSTATDFDDEGVEAGDKICVSGSTYNDGIWTVSSISSSGAGTNNLITLVETPVDEGTADVEATISVDGLRVKCILLPETDATTVEDFIHDKYENAIEDGATADLLMRPAEKWRNFELGAFYQAKYNAEKSRIFREVRHGAAGAYPGGIRA